MPMTLYFVGGEDFDFTPFGTTSVDQTAGHFRGAFARCGLRAEDGDSGWDTGNLGDFTEVWFHARVFMERSFYARSILVSEPPAERAPIKIVDANGIVRLIIHLHAFFPASNTNPGRWTFATVDAAGVATSFGPVFSAFFSGNPDEPDALDIHIANYDVVDGGSIKVWIRGTLAYAVSGVTLATDGNTSISGIRFSGCGSPLYQDINVWYHTYSEVIVAGEDTRGLELATLIPDADGNLDNWTIGGVENINEVVLDDSTGNASLVAGQIQQYTTVAPPSGSYGVAAVSISARAQKGFLGGPTKIDFGVRTNGTDYWGSDINLPAIKERVATIFATNPDTGGAFTISELSDPNFNIGMKSVS